MKNKIIILILISFFTIGCSYKEIDELSIVSAIGIDYINNKYVVTVEVMDLEKENDDTNKSSLLYTSSGLSISDALKNIHLEYPDTLYLGHTELIVIGQSIIKSNNIDKIFDFFLRDPEARTDCLILGSNDNDAKDIINSNDNNTTSFPSKDLISSIKNSKEITGYVVEQSLENFIIDYYEEGINPVITNVTLDDNNNTLLEGIIVFKKNKYIDKLDYNNSFIYNLINNNYETALINIEYDNSNIDLEISSKTDIKLNIKDNQLIYDINIFIEALVSELHTNIDFNTDKGYKTIEDITNNYIKEKTNDLINYSIDNNVDLFGLKNILYKYKYKEYKKYKDNNLYNISKININVNTSVYRYGNISKGDDYES